MVTRLGVLTSVRSRYWSHVTYRRLAPLWQALCTELPQLVLDEARDLDFALYRRVIEIHDGRLALRPYTPELHLITASLECCAPRRGLRGIRREAVVEAALIAAALNNHRAGCGSARRSAGVGFDPPGAVSGTLEAEADWLAQVSMAFSRLRSPVDTVVTVTA